MSISQTIRDKIKTIDPGTLFTQKDFAEINNPQAVILELSRLSKKGIVKRLSKGKYYIPKKTKYGELGPSEWQILDNIIKENGGYFAGNMALNRIGVTSQIPSEILIRAARSTRKLKVGSINIRFERQGIKDIDYTKSRITDVIEALRLLKKTPDGDTKLSLERVSSLLSEFSTSDLNLLIKALQEERPYVRALAGALLELQNNKAASAIKTTLNPVSRYKLNLDIALLPNKKRWSII
ncbi:hypothetical protein K2P97_10370 [bacterium]|nr:hypothetical protein [bacterium]